MIQMKNNSKTVVMAILFSEYTGNKFHLQRYKEWKRNSEMKRERHLIFIILLFCCSFCYLYYRDQPRVNNLQMVLAWCSNKCSWDSFKIISVWHLIHFYWGFFFKFKCMLYCMILIRPLNVANKNMSTWNCKICLVMPVSYY